VLSSVVVFSSRRRELNTTTSTTMPPLPRTASFARAQTHQRRPISQPQDPTHGHDRFDQPHSFRDADTARLWRSSGLVWCARSVRG
jgi:hypothetical protein